MVKRIVITLPDCFKQNSFTFVPDRKDSSINISLHGVSYFVPVLKIEIFYAQNSMQLEYHMDVENDEGVVVPLIISQSELVVNKIAKTESAQLPKVLTNRTSSTVSTT